MYITMNYLQFIQLFPLFCPTLAAWNESYFIHNILMKDYDPLVRPVINSSQPVYLWLSLGIKSFIEVDMKKQTLVSYGWLSVLWDDEFLTWNTDEHPVSLVHLTSDMIWRPELVILNSVRELDALEDQKIKVNVYNSGLVMWFPGGLFETYCSIDISHYPLDTQSCSIDVMSWSLDNSFLNGSFADIPFEMNTTENHPEWTLVSTQTLYSLTASNDWVLSFKFILRRKVMFYVINVLLPIVLLSQMNCLVFMLPVESGEKMTVSVTVFLSFAVFMSMINESLPQNSDSLCLFSAFVAVQMFLSVCSIVMASVVVFIFEQDKRETTPKSSLPSFFSRDCSSSDPSHLTVGQHTQDKTEENVQPIMATSTVSSHEPNASGVRGTSETRDDVRGQNASSVLPGRLHRTKLGLLNFQDKRQLSVTLDRVCLALTLCLNVLSSVVFITVMTCT